MRTIEQIQRQKCQSRAYQKAMLLLKDKYRKEFWDYFETEATGPTYVKRYRNTLRYLRFRHPKVFKKHYKSFLEMELG